MKTYSNMFLSKQMKNNPAEPCRFFQDIMEVNGNTAQA